MLTSEHFVIGNARAVRGHSYVRHALFLAFYDSSTESAQALVGRNQWKGRGPLHGGDTGCGPSRPRTRHGATRGPSRPQLSAPSQGEPQAVHGGPVIWVLWCSRAGAHAVDHTLGGETGRHRLASGGTRQWACQLGCSTGCDLNRLRHARVIFTPRPLSPWYPWLLCLGAGEREAGSASCAGGVTSGGRCWPWCPPTALA